MIFSDGIAGQNTYKEGNTWLFLTLVVNGTTISNGFSSYVDDFEMPVKHSPDFSNKVTGSGDLVIGVEDPDNIQYYASVWVDDLTFWNRKFSADEVQKLYQSAVN